MYSLELSWGNSNKYTQNTFSWQNKKISLIYLEICFLEISEEIYQKNS